MAAGEMWETRGTDKGAGVIAIHTALKELPELRELTATPRFQNGWRRFSEEPGL
jgi:hypothetical protein